MSQDNKIQPFQLPKGKKPEAGHSDAHFWDIDEETDRLWRKRINYLYKKREKNKDK